MSATFDALVPGGPTLAALSDEAPLLPFDPAALAFIDALSRALMGSGAARRHPELVALGYWLRKTNVGIVRQTILSASSGQIRVPRGTAFHIAPSNVDSIFIYSWLLSLLAGNKNIVRVSSKSSEQAALLLDHVCQLLQAPEHAQIARRTMLIRYPADTHTTALLSAACDVRVIWGGDKTVATIRSIALAPTALDVAFADKYSLALIDLQGWHQASDAHKHTAVQAFYNDAYWFDQMACSSPRMVLWVGSPDILQTAQADFWQRLEALLEERAVTFAPIAYVNKLLALHSIAIATPQAHLPSTRNNTLSRVWVDHPQTFSDIHEGNGLFIESRLDSLTHLPALLSRKIQTVSYFGFLPETLSALLVSTPVRGIDRVVPFGQAMAFSHIWDGFDLFQTFTRQITVA